MEKDNFTLVEELERKVKELQHLKKKTKELGRKTREVHQSEKKLASPSKNNSKSKVEMESVLVKETKKSAKKTQSIFNTISTTMTQKTEKPEGVFLQNNKTLRLKQPKSQERKTQTDTKTTKNPKETNKASQQLQEKPKNEKEEAWKGGWDSEKTQTFRSFSTSNRNTGSFSASVCNPCSNFISLAKGGAHKPEKIQGSQIKTSQTLTEITGSSCKLASFGSQIRLESETALKKPKNYGNMEMKEKNQKMKYSGRSVYNEPISPSLLQNEHPKKKEISSLAQGSTHPLMDGYLYRTLIHGMAEKSGEKKTKRGQSARNSDKRGLNHQTNT